MDIKAFRGLSGTYNVMANERDRCTPNKIECLVKFLDGTEQAFTVDRTSKGQVLLNNVFQHLNLIEKDFFGLKFKPNESQPQSTRNSSLLIKAESSNSASVSSQSSSLLSSVINASNAQCQSKTKSNLNATPGNHKSEGTSPHTDPEDSDNQNKDSQTTAVTSSSDDNEISSRIEERWLDPTRSIRKQCKSRYKFYFRVRFYVSDPCKLVDDTTRNHLYLQLRQDILKGRLEVSSLSSAILLASYVLQSEVGKYRPELLELDYASNFRLLPELSDDMKEKVIELHKQHERLSSADAEYAFLEHAAKNLDCYGVEFHDAKDSDKNDVKIGVSSSSIVTYKNRSKVDQFSWAKIVKIMFKKKIFSIQVKRDETIEPGLFDLIEFNLLTSESCKSFWEDCVAQHSFFRLHQPKSPPRKFFSFFNFGSKFQYSGKTEYQTMEESRRRSFSHFYRSQSVRFARRTLPIGRPSWSVLGESITAIKESLRDKSLLAEFDRLSRKNDDESFKDSRLAENVAKNRYQDILPYDHTRVHLYDSMTGDYINASFVDMPVPSGRINRYIATQGPLKSTCDDFWQMIWEQHSSLIIMVTPLVESGRIKCHKYWPDEKSEVRYGQILVRNIREKSKSATVERTIQLVDVKSGEKRVTTQIQYKAWPDHAIPKDCSDFLKLIKRVRKHREANTKDPIVVHCSAGIGRTGVLILMETAICYMESKTPVYPIKILEEMRKKRAMLIQTQSQFQFVAEAICRVYDHKHTEKEKYR